MREMISSCRSAQVVYLSCNEWMINMMVKREKAKERKQERESERERERD